VNVSTMPVIFYDLNLTPFRHSEKWRKGVGRLAKGRFTRLACGSRLNGLQFGQGLLSENPIYCRETLAAPEREQPSYLVQTDYVAHVRGNFCQLISTC